jgi:hypothetical protein
MCQLAWTHRDKVFREFGAYSRNYARALIDSRRILRTVDLAQVERMRKAYAAQVPPPHYLKYLSISDFMKVALNCAYRLNLHRSPPKTILDIATGAGYFPYVCNYLGHRAMGADVGDVEIFNDLTRLLNIERKVWVVRPLERAPDFGLRFDLVTAFQSGFDYVDPPGGGRGIPWGVAEWDFFLTDLADNCLHEEGAVMLSGFNRPEKKNPAVLAFFMDKGAEIHDGRVHFRSMRSFGSLRTAVHAGN